MTGSGAKREFSGTLLNDIEVRAIAVATQDGLTSWEVGQGWERREIGCTVVGVRGKGDWMHGGRGERGGRLDARW